MLGANNQPSKYFASSQHSPIHERDLFTDFRLILFISLGTITLSEDANRSIKELSHCHFVTSLKMNTTCSGTLLALLYLQMLLCLSIAIYMLDKMFNPARLFCFTLGIIQRPKISLSTHNTAECRLLSDCYTSIYLSRKIIIKQVLFLA